MTNLEMNLVGWGFAILLAAVVFAFALLGHTWERVLELEKRLTYTQSRVDGLAIALRDKRIKG